MDPTKSVPQPPDWAQSRGLDEEANLIAVRYQPRETDADPEGRHPYYYVWDSEANENICACRDIADAAGIAKRMNDAWLDRLKSYMEQIARR